MNEIPIIAVLLTCHNRKQKTLRCLKQVLTQEGKDLNFKLKIYLVDDASSDGTTEAILSEYPMVNLIKGDGNLYWSKGMHLAWKTAAEKQNHDFYLWLNDDVFIFQNAILTMLENYTKSGSDAVICGATKSEFTNEYTYGGQTNEGNNLIPNGSLQHCTIMNGNFVLVSQNIFIKVGIIDNFFPHSIGDHDYGLRAIKKGIPVLIAPSYIGYCEKHEQLPKWCLTRTPLLERIKSLYSPLGNCHPYYFFVYEKRHFGIMLAIKHFFSIHIRALFPALWIR